MNNAKNTKIKSLAMLKMEKNFIAVNEKNYPQSPYDVLDTGYLVQRLLEEVQELHEAYCQQDCEAMKKEVADCSNVLDYIFERLCDGRTR